MRRRLVAVVPVVVGLCVSTGLAPASAAVPAGSVLVGPSTGTTTRILALAATPSALAMVAAPATRGATGTTDLWTEPPTGGVAELARTGVDDIVSVAGDRLLLRVSSTGLAWYDTGSGATGTAPVGWLAAAEDGGLLLESAGDGSVSLVDQAVDGSTRSLGTVPGLTTSNASTARVLADSTGAAVLTDTTIEYLDYATSVFSPVDHTDVPTFLCVGIDHGVIGCAVNARSLDGLDAVRLQAGHAPIRTSVGLDTSYQVDDVVVSPTGTAVAWTNPNKPNSQRGVEIAFLDGTSTSLGDTQRVAPTDDGFLGSDGSAIVRLEDASSRPPAGLLPPPVVTDAAITTGRVAWGQPTLAAEFSQPYTWSQARVTVGSYVKIGTASTQGDVPVAVASGTRTVFNHGSTPFVVVTGTGPTVRLPLCTATTRPSVSGVHALCTEAGGHLVLYDLVTRVGTDLSASAGIAPGAAATLSGTQVFFAGADGWISRYDLTTRASTHVVAASGVLQLQAFGDWVAWTTDSTTVRWSRWDIPRAPARSGPGRLVGASAGGVVVATDDAGTSLLRPWGGAGAVALPAHTVGVSGSTALFLAGGTPHLFALNHEVDRPRSLGNPDIPTSVRTGSTWTFDLPTTTSLTHCTVDVTSGTTRIRSLPCDAAAAAQGEAQVTWDGRDSAGNLVRPRAYTWIVKASNRDGTILDVDGDTAVVRGTVTVTS